MRKVVRAPIQSISLKRVLPGEQETQQPYESFQGDVRRAVGREEGVLGPALKDNKEQTLGCRARGTKGLGSGPQQGAEFTKGSCASLPSPCLTVWKEIITWQNIVESQVKLPEVIGKARYHLDKARCLDLCCPSPLKQIEQKAECNQL